MSGFSVNRDVDRVVLRYSGEQELAFVLSVDTAHELAGLLSEMADEAEEFGAELYATD